MRTRSSFADWEIKCSLKIRAGTSGYYSYLEKKNETEFSLRSVCFKGMKLEYIKTSGLNDLKLKLQ